MRLETPRDFTQQTCEKTPATVNNTGSGEPAKLPHTKTPKSRPTKLSKLDVLLGGRLGRTGASSSRLSMHHSLLWLVGWLVLWTTTRAAAAEHPLNRIYKTDSPERVREERTNSSDDTTAGSLSVTARAPPPSYHSAAGAFRARCWRRRKGRAKGGRRTPLDQRPPPPRRSLWRSLLPPPPHRGQSRMELH